MPLATTVRTMVEDDIPAVLDIQAACYTQIIPESGPSLLAKLRASQPTCFIALHGSTVAGYLIAVPWILAQPPALHAEDCPLPSAPDCLYLHDLAVAPAARSSGAGRLLVEAFLARLGPLGLHRASLVAVQDSGPYWERYGFRAVTPSATLRATLASYGDGVQYMALECHASTP